jgi:hypothetical protein
MAPKMTKCGAKMTPENGAENDARFGKEVI